VGTNGSRKRVFAKGLSPEKDREQLDRRILKQIRREMILE
jgi:hypothetical protein